MHVVDAADRLTGEVEHDVAFGEARGFGRAAGHQVGDHRGARRCQLEAARKPRVERHALRRDAEPTAPDPSVAHDTGGDIGGGVDTDRKADSLRGTDHRGVDADGAAVAVDQRAAGIAGLSGASVWMTLSISRPDGLRRLRPSALTMPAVTVA